MRSAQYVVKLKPKQQSALDRIVHQGKHSARVINRARILLLSHQGIRRSQIARTLSLSAGVVTNICRRYQTEGLSVLHDKQRPGRPPKIYGKIEAKLVAIACSTPPEGSVRWTMRMLADEMVELELLDSISHKAVWERLKKTTLSHGSRNRGV
jgi:transposase